jgi:hypothetical protein
LLCAALLCGGIALAEKPVQNVNPQHHPNLAAAQRLSEQAYQKIVAAQEATSRTCKVTPKRPKNWRENFSSK